MTLTFDGRTPELELLLRESSSLIQLLSSLCNSALHYKHH